MSKYKWAYPQDWLMEKAQKAASEGDTATLLSFLNDIVPHMDADEIQDLFESEMDADGFFTEEGK